MTSIGRPRRACSEHWQERVNIEPSAWRTLLTATLAAAHQLTVVHYDADFETAATALTFQHRWVLPRGSV
jgi:predicted nucleic acid-binding protein